MKMKYFRYRCCLYRCSRCQLRLRRERATTALCRRRRGLGPLCETLVVIGIAIIAQSSAIFEHTRRAIDRDEVVQIRNPVRRRYFRRRSRSPR